MLKIVPPNWSSWFNIVSTLFTSILEIAFRDEDKKLINMVLDQIIEAYKEYSGKGKRRNQI